MDRRDFLKTSTLAGMTAVSASRVMGANDRIRLGIIGTGGRGSYLMTEANKCGGIEWVAVCDAWNVRRDEALQLAGSGVRQVRGLPRTARPERYRRRDRRHLGQHALPHFDRRLQNRQGRVCREAHDVASRAGAAACARCPRVWPGVADRRAAAQHPALRRGQGTFLRQRADRRCPHGPDRLELQRRLPHEAAGGRGEETRGSRLGGLPGFATEDSVGPQALLQPLFLHGPVLRPDRRPVRPYDRCGAVVFRALPSAIPSWRVAGSTSTTTDAIRRTMST